jgi:hypothetical protein
MLMVARRTDAGWFASGGAPDLSLAISLSATAGARMFPILIVISLPIFRATALCNRRHSRVYVRTEK